MTVLENARAVAHLDTDEVARRRDFRDLPIVTIDGETARDFDDAVLVTHTRNGYELQVHIADVAQYVTPGSPLDLEARLRGTSVYFPDRAVPMLPQELSIRYLQPAPVGRAPRPLVHHATGPTWCGAQLRGLRRRHPLRARA